MNSSKSSLDEELFDTILKNIAVQMNRETDEEIDRIVEEMKSEPPFVPSKRFERNMKKAIAKATKELRPEGPTPYNGRMSFRVAIVLAAVIVLLLFSVNAAANSRGETLWGFIFSNKSQYTEIDLTDTKDEDFIAEETGLSQFYMLVNVPASYELVDVKNRELFCEFIYSNGKNELWFVQNKINQKTDLTIDTELTNYQHVKVNGVEAAIVKKNSWIHLYFHNDSYSFTLSGDGLSKKQILKIAENVKFIQR